MGAQVFDKMNQYLAARSSDAGPVKWMFLGARVCLRSWKALHGMGTLAAKWLFGFYTTSFFWPFSLASWSCSSGGHRFARIWKAVQRGDSAAPADLRFLRKPKTRTCGDGPNPRITSFLQSLYDSTAETLPDVKDDGVETTFSQGVEGLDSYAVVNLDGSSGSTENGKKRKIRKFKLGLPVHVERQPEQSGQEVRYLPPGVMRDYWSQMQSIDSSVSFTTFWRTWKIEFPHLRFRAVSSHAQCSTCVHHRVLLRELAPYLYARRRQAELFHSHLMAQYRDRQVYWSLRGSSRLRVLGHLCVIQDGMDQVKFCFPRTPLARSKELATFIRPKLGIIGVIAHGFCLYFSVSNPEMPKDSSCMADLFCFVLTHLERKGVKLADTVIHLVSDNTSRETKNNTTLRLLTALVQQRTNPLCHLKFSFYLLVCVLVYLLVCLFVCLLVCLFVCVFVFVCLLACFYCLLACVCVCLLFGCFCWFVCSFVRLSVWLFGWFVCLVCCFPSRFCFDSGWFPVSWSHAAMISSGSCHQLCTILGICACQGILAGASMRHLRSGHSHEDVDQVFGSLSLYLVRHGKCVESPPQFVDLIRTFCNTAHRPHEPERCVVMYDQHRPWTLLGEFL